MPTLETIAGAAEFSIARAPSRRGPASWLAPDLAMAAALATLICLFAGFGGATALFRDSDAGWHIRNGEGILARHRLPDVDAFSFSKAGALWMDWEWASDLLTGAVHRAAGLAGVATLYGLAIAASVWMWFRLNWAVGNNFVLAAVLAAPMITTTDLHWLARPHLWGWLFALATVWFCECAPRQMDTRHLCVIALLSACWANMHGSFLLGPAIMLVYAVGGWLRSRIWNTSGQNGSLFFAAIAAAAGSLLNPHGWLLHQHIAAYLLDGRLLDKVGEFQSFNFHSPGSPWVIATLITSMAGGAAALVVRRADRFLLSIALTALALTSARYLPLAALLLLPLANASISDALSLARGLNPELRRKLDRFFRYGDALRVFDRRFHGAALAPLAAIILFAVTRAHAGFAPADFPVAAANAVSALPGDARLFSTDKFGGYLIYRFAGNRKVFFDGRSDFYGADFVDGYARIIEVRPGWRQEFERWNFTHALLPPDAALLAGLESDGWRELHRDRTAVLLERFEKTRPTE